VYFQTRYLLQIAREVYLTDRVAMNDRSHREQEWNFGTGPDRDRWQRVLALTTACRGERWGDVLEIGCAEGIITAQIVGHADRLVAGDISRVARERAARRVAGAAHVQIIPLDLQRDALDTYDVVFAMDVLEFVHGRRRVSDTVAKLAAAVRPGGLLVLSMCRYPADIRDAWWQRWVPEGADAVLPLIEAHPALTQIHRESHPADGQPIPDYLHHLIALFRRK
jgi:2-polyprenyl-3-methyl-5-hydroxy-6-metoxy-1,4-benzoquinol methylase